VSTEDTPKGDIKMPLNAPAVGEVLLLRYMLNHTANTNKVIRLYKNDPDHTSDALTNATITECNELGYAPITLAGTLWTFTNIASVVTALYSEVAFTFTTGASVFGYYVSSTTASELLWIERFSGAPFTLPAGGGTIAISPRVTLD